MKATWTKIYGPPFDYAKQAQREMAHWSKVGFFDFDPSAPSVVSVFQQMLATAEKICAADASLLAKECPLNFANGDFNQITPKSLSAELEKLSDQTAAQAAKGYHDSLVFALCGTPITMDDFEPLPNGLTERLRELGIPNTSIPYLRNGYASIKRDGDTAFLVEKDTPWSLCLSRCGL